MGHWFRVATETTQTRCPHCRVAFHITHSQLAAAAGKVRCGICLEVFDASENASASGSDQVLPADDVDREDLDRSLTPVPVPVSDPEQEQEQEQEQDLNDKTLVSEIPTDDATHVDPDSALTEADNGQLIDNQQAYHSQQLDDIYKTLPELDLLSTAPPDPDGSGLIRWSVYLLILAAIGLLVIQLLFFTSTDLSRKDGYRPILQIVCGVLGCPISQQRNIKLIATDALVIQSHPTNKSALKVDVVLTNRASFPQAFPGLQLQFENLKGKTVARRKFRPAEYLQGELAEFSVMTPNISYRVRLDILAPDKSAISYALIVTN